MITNTLPSLTFRLFTDKFRSLPHKSKWLWFFSLSSFQRLDAYSLSQINFFCKVWRSFFVGREAACFWTGRTEKEYRKWWHSLSLFLPLSLLAPSLFSSLLPLTTIVEIVHRLIRSFSFCSLFLPFPSSFLVSPSLPSFLLTVLHVHLIQNSTAAALLCLPPRSGAASGGARYSA